MILTSTTLLMVSLGFLAADDPKKDDAEAIKGKWVAVSIKAGGFTVPEEAAGSFKFKFDGKEYVNTNMGQTEEGGYTIDSSKSPKTIDFDIKTGNDKGKKQLGVYKLDGDKLTIVAATAGETERPKSIEPGANDQVLMIVLQRQKP